MSDDGGATWREQELARTKADSDQPHLVTATSAMVLLWRTQDEGIRIVALDKARP
jgi:photosystem II stability/assembly factor-like uncharacterized protein